MRFVSFLENETAPEVWSGALYPLMYISDMLQYQDCYGQFRVTSIESNSVIVQVYLFL